MVFFVFFCGGNSYSYDYGDGEYIYEVVGYDYDGVDYDYDYEGYDYDYDGEGYYEVGVYGEGVVYMVVYVCFMYCEGSGSEMEGKCFVCNMDYVV